MVYVISDALGETGELVAKAAISQFKDKDISVRRFPYVNSKEDLAEIVEEASNYNCVIAYTLVWPELEDYLLKLAAKENIMTVNILGPLIDTLAKVNNVQPVLEPGLVRKMDEQYFRKIDAVEFAVKYDDGKDPKGLLLADLVIIGVSRTSKTPLSMYLAHKRLRTANVPLVPEAALPEELFQISPNKIFGLIINQEQLYQIRGERLKALGLTGNASYASIDRIQHELEYAQKIMNKLGCHIIDVTNRAVEETASKVLDIYYEEEHNGY
ncbi:pyruvate, water dikinase regulatory protein [Bacillota bacterium LX-D]|nr:pyruvate, water dikinase regulatory protein [Bacillota bacterium LX-D]